MPWYKRKVIFFCNFYILQLDLTSSSETNHFFRPSVWSFFKLTWRGYRSYKGSLAVPILQFFNVVQLADDVLYMMIMLSSVRSHFVPTTNCPTSIFRATNCPKMSHFLPLRQNVPFPPRRQNAPLMILLNIIGWQLFHWHFSGDKLSQGDKMSLFLPGDKMSQLMHLCTWKLWKVVGTFCRQWKRLLGQFVASEKGDWDNLLQVKKATLGHI